MDGDDERPEKLMQKALLYVPQCTLTISVEVSLGRWVSRSARRFVDSRGYFSRSFGFGTGASGTHGTLCIRSRTVARNFTNMSKCSTDGKSIVNWDSKTIRQNEGKQCTVNENDLKLPRFFVQWLNDATSWFRTNYVKTH